MVNLIDLIVPGSEINMRFPMQINDRGEIGGVVLAAVLALTVIAWGADSNVGTWKLNLDKSKYSPGPAPKSQTLTIEASDGGIKYTSDGENAEGSSVHVEFTAKYDGMDNPVTGSPAFDSIALKRIDANTIESTTKKDGTVMATSRTVISKDGKTRTVTIKGKNAKGQDVNNVVVYDKQ
jgi:hypothetical protein